MNRSDLEKLNEMKKIALLTFVVLGMTAINSCKKDKGLESEPDNSVTAEKTNVHTYEIISLIAHGNLADRYDATFSSISIELLKTSDSTLTFYVPDIEEGEASLKFDLATIEFNVAKTADVNANQLIIDITANFEAQVDLLNPITQDETNEVNSLSQYKQEVISLFNSLTEDEKRQTVLFYEANKEVFQSFASNSFANLDASTTMNKQSDCLRDNFKSFYGCTAGNLGGAAIGLASASKEFLAMLALAGVSAYLAPASFGLSAVGTVLALGTAGYLLMTEVRPAALHLKHSTIPFLKANWIFSKALFQSRTEVFQDQVSTNLNLNPEFHSLTSNDGDVNSGSDHFINSMTSLSNYWNKLTSIFGDFPTYTNTQESTTLSANEVTISNISNSNVEFVNQTGEEAKFKSLSGNEENFSFDITVNKEGFTQTETVDATLIAQMFNPAGVWIYNNFNNGQPWEGHEITFDANGASTNYRYKSYANNTEWTDRPWDSWIIERLSDELWLNESYYGDLYKMNIDSINQTEFDIYYANEDITNSDWTYTITKQ